MPLKLRMLGLNFRILLRFWFPVFAYSGSIYWVSSRANLKTPFEAIGFDKIMHGLECFPLGWLLARALLCDYVGLNEATLLALVAACCFLYGVSDEIHQSFVIGRTSDALDVLADTIGGLIGAWAYSHRQKGQNYGRS